MYDNYFPEIEEKASEFIRDYKLDSFKNMNSKKLENILQEQFGYEIISEDFTQYHELNTLRSLFVPEKKLLLLNQLLDENQKIFILAKEIGFNILGITLRPNTYSWVDFESFEELLNNFYASYFAGCLLIPKDEIVECFSDFLSEKKWNPEKFDALINRFTNSPETFYYRLTNVLSSEIGLKDLFYLCFTKKKESDKIIMLKELHLNHQQAPHAKATNEHYCRRWVAVKNLNKLTDNEKLTDAQISHYKDSGLSYLVISTSQKNPFSDGTNRSYCIGILLNSNSLKKIHFAKSESIQTENVGVTCETCSIADCEVRQAPPIRIEKEIFNENIKKSILKIRKDLL